MSGEQMILDRLPHRPPFRFITALTALEPGSFGTGEWLISGKEDFLAGHFPDEPIVPGVLLAESLAQLAGLVGYGQHGQHGSVRHCARLAQVDLKFGAAVIPPAVVVLHAKLTRNLLGLSLFEVRAMCGEATVASGTLTLSTARMDKKDRPS